MHNMLKLMTRRIQATWEHINKMYPWLHYSNKCSQARLLPTNLTNIGLQAMASPKFSQYPSLYPSSWPQNSGDPPSFLEFVSFPDLFSFHLPGMFKCWPCSGHSEKFPATGKPHSPTSWGRSTCEEQLLPQLGAIIVTKQPVGSYLCQHAKTSGNRVRWKGNKYFIQRICSLN